MSNGKHFVNQYLKKGKNQDINVSVARDFQFLSVIVLGWLVFDSWATSIEKIQNYANSNTNVMNPA